MPAAHPDTPVDLEITVASVPPMDAGLRVDPGGRVVLEVAGVGRFRAEDGRRIVVDPDGVPITSPHLRTFLLGTGIGAIFHQRGLLPLHASMVRIGSAAVAVIGPSGAGKSTLAHAFCRAGCDLVADDITPLTFSAGARPVAWPLLPQVKLWRDALDRDRIPTDDLETIAMRTDKYRLPAAEGFACRPVPLGTVVVLAEGPEAALKPLSGLKGLSAIRREIYRPGIGAAVRGSQAMFLDAGRVAAQVDVLLLERPRDPDAIGALAELVAATVLDREAEASVV